MNAPRKAKKVSELDLDKALQADFEYDYFEEHMESVPSIMEGLGYDE